MTARFRILFAAAALAVIAVVGMPNSTHAQGGGFHGAGGKITGEAYWPARAPPHGISSGLRTMHKISRPTLRPADRSQPS